MQVDIPAGTFFVNDDPQSQNMVVLHPTGLALQPGERADVLLDVACANLRRSEPTGSDTFTVQRARVAGLERADRQALWCRGRFPGRTGGGLDHHRRRQL